MLQGYKTYIVAALIALLTAAHTLGYVDDETYKNLLAILAAGGTATVAAKINRLGKGGLVILISLLFPSFAQAQPPVGSTNQRFAIDQQAPTLADAQGYTYKYYPDGATTGVNFTGVICAGTTSPFQCTVPIPAFTPGNHTITITATNLAGESTKSTPFAFNFVVTPSAPTNIRIVTVP